MTTGYSRYERVPFAMGSIRGIRAWEVVRGGQLEAVAKPYRWTPGENKAGCFMRDYLPGSYFTLTKDGGHSIASKYCTCGFYAYWATDNVEFAAPNRVVGIVEAYGKVTFADRGFRAEKAKIVALYAPGYVRPVARTTKQRRLAKRLEFLERYTQWKVRAVFLALWIVGIFISSLLDEGRVNRAVMFAQWTSYAIFITSVWSDVFLPRLRRKVGGATKMSSAEVLQQMVSNIHFGKGNLPTEDNVTYWSKWILAPQWEAIEKRYPDVKIYGDFAEMLANHPVTAFADIEHIGTED